MKLRGSQTELAIRETLLKANIAKSDAVEHKKMITFLSLEYSVPVSSVFTSHWIPEGDMDFLRILVNGSFVVDLEIEKAENKFQITDYRSIEQYRLGLKRQDQIKLKVAMDLAEGEL